MKVGVDAVPIFLRQAANTNHRLVQVMCDISLCHLYTWWHAKNLELGPTKQMPFFLCPRTPNWISLWSFSPWCPIYLGWSLLIYRLSIRVSQAKYKSLLPYSLFLCFCVCCRLLYRLQFHGKSSHSVNQTDGVASSSVKALLGEDKGTMIYFGNGRAKWLKAEFRITRLGTNSTLSCCFIRGKLFYFSKHTAWYVVNIQ